MTRSEQVEALKPYFETLSEHMELQDTQLFFSDEVPSSRDAHASIVCWEGRRRATLRFSKDFLEDTPEEKRSSACHELTHCHFDAAYKIAERSMDPKVFDAWRLMFEHGVDAISAVVAKYMPLPPPDEPEKQAQVKKRKR